MTDPQKIVIAACNQDGDWLSVEVAWDAQTEDLAHALRTVAFWLTFTPDHVVPDPYRDWGYRDEDEKDGDD